MSTMRSGKRRRVRSDVPIAVLGMGHVGLPTALMFAEMGFEVIGADTDAARIAALAAGQAPFYEPGMEEMLRKQVSNPRFILTSDIEQAVRRATVLFICVGTPQLEDGAPDLAQVEQLARTIARNLNGYKLLVEKSTVPAVTGQWIKKTVARYATRVPSAPGNGSGKAKGNGADHPAAKDAGGLRREQLERSFDVASNPEFLKEGTALRDCFHPERVVCGVETVRAKRLLAGIYRPLNRPILFTDITTAELIKHAANAFLATKISFINTVADICDAIGADVTKVAAGIGMDSRIGPAFLEAGLGFGGYCLPKDLRAFVHLAEENRVDVGLLREVESVNQHRIGRLMARLREALWIISGKKIAVFGLSFKAGTDDVRESPSMVVVRRLLGEGAVVQAYDPQAVENARRVLPDKPGELSYHASAYEAAVGAHAILILTDWPELRALDWECLRGLVDVPVIVDGRNLLQPAAVQSAGFEYFCLGRNARAARAVRRRKAHAPSPAAQVRTTAPAPALPKLAGTRP